MQLILIRHPESQANVKRLVYGHTDWDYSPKGEQSVEVVANFVHRAWFSQGTQHTNLDGQFNGKVMLYSSPLKRAATLAHRIAEKLRIPVELDQDIIEMNVGIFENLTEEELLDRHREEWESYMQDYENYLIPEGESWTMVHERVGRFLNRIREQAKSDQSEEDFVAVVVCHAMVIRGLLMHLLHLNLSGTWEFDIQPASITALRWEEGFAQLTSLIQVEQMH